MTKAIDKLKIELEEITRKRKTLETKEKELIEKIEKREAQEVISLMRSNDLQVHELKEIIQKSCDTDTSGGGANM